MGAILAKFKTEKTTTEILERLEEKIHQIEDYTLNTQEQKKRFVGNFLAFSIGVYVLAFIIFYFIYFPPTWKERFTYSIPLFLFPVVIVLLRRLFTWHFQRKLNKNSVKLTALRAEKKKILEQVMDKETYKVAVNLLARFGEKNNSNKLFALTPRSPPTSSISQSVLHSNNRLASMSESGNQSNSTPAMNARNLVTTPLSSISRIGAVGTSNQLAIAPSLRANQELRRRTPFPLVNHQEKGIFERIVDVLIGDGPHDRFAMICKQCFAHNGMALKEEFDYATFRCAFCNAMNPSRKERPVAPRLPLQPSATQLNTRDSSDSSTSDHDSDVENQELPEKLHGKMTESNPAEATLTSAEQLKDKIPNVNAAGFESEFPQNWELKEEID